MRGFVNKEHGRLFGQFSRIFGFFKAPKNPEVFFRDYHNNFLAKFSFLQKIWKMKNRFFYLDGKGEMQGPLWLSQMRDLYGVGRLSNQTEVCREGDGLWDGIHAFPEITVQETQMRGTMQDVDAAQRKAYERRLWIWLAGLIVLYAVYLIV